MLHTKSEMLLLLNKEVGRFYARVSWIILSTILLGIVNAIISISYLKLRLLILVSIELRIFFLVRKTLKVNVGMLYVENISTCKKMSFFKSINDYTIGFLHGKINLTRIKIIQESRRRKLNDVKS